jgi:hypothetical protein
MNIAELYARTPVERYSEIVVSGDRPFFDGEEYIILTEGELKLVRSHKELEQHLAQISTMLGIK